MTKNFIVYRSSAGSGKTYTLVRDYLALALGSPVASRYRKILAITFTNKAAEEMKNRVLDQLAKIAAGDASDLHSSLCDATNTSVKELQQRAQSALRHMLHNYSDLSICTIDKFMHQLIRAFSRDLTLSQDFDVETDATPLLEEAVGQIVERVGSDPLTTSVLIEWVESQIEKDRNWQIESELVKTGKDKVNLQSEPFLQRLSEFDPAAVVEVRKALTAYCNAFENDITRHGTAAMTLIRSKNLSAEAFHFKTNGVYNYILKLAEGEVLTPAKKRARAAIDEGKFENNKATAEEKSALAEIIPEITAHLLAVDRIRAEKESTYLIFQDLLRHLFQMVLLNELHLSMEQLKTEKNLIFVDDFHRKISAVVQREPAPFIYERMGHRYLDILIDEFQDTSTTQWHNFLPLVADALSKGGRAMLVGDGKQAIYRWRGGEVEQFDQLPKVITDNEEPIWLEHQRLLRDQYREEHLEKNWRSLGRIVDFNNKLYTALKAHIPESLQSVYSDVEQELHRNNTGLVIFDLVEFQNKAEGDLEYIGRVREAIATSLRDGYQQNDICVITRRNEESQKVVHALNGATVNGEVLQFISNESLLIDHDPAVKWAVAFMRHLSDPTHTGHALQALIRSVQLFAPSAENHDQLKTYAVKQNGRLSKAGVMPFMHDRGAVWERGKLLALNLFDLVTRLAADAPNQAVFETAHWSFFKQRVLQFSNDHGSDLVAFLSWWSDNADRFSLSIPQESNAVRTMSIHKSKGLQFPVVLLPFCDWNFKHNQATYWADTPDGVKAAVSEPLPEVMISSFSKKLEESELSDQIAAEEVRILLDNLNLLYVATTRAQERLYLFSRQRTPQEKPSNVAHWLSAYAEKMGWNDFPVVIGDEGHRSDYFPKDQSPAKKPQAAVSLPIANHSGWQQKIRISLEAGALVEGRMQPTKKAIGNMVHRLLAEVTHAKDLEDVLMAHRARGDIEPNLLDEVSAQMRAVVQGAETASWFAEHDKILVEYPIVTPDGQMVRPDRIVIDDRHATVIDYKTGAPNTAHEHQIRHYGQLLETMGYRCSLNLYYVETNSVVSVAADAQTSLF